MKKLFRTMLCAALLAVTVCVPTFAAESNDLLISPKPISQPVGDFGVLVNGEYVAFTDAVPQIKNDRSCLPFVAVFEQLGFSEENMTWNAETKTVTAVKTGVDYIGKDGTKRTGNVNVELTIGSNTFNVWYDVGILASHIEGQDVVMNTYTTEAVPYIDPATSRTYIPFGLVADALGYNVGWDADDRVVIIDDVDAILAANEETYELMDKYLAYSQSFAQKNQKVTGGYTFDMFMDMTTPEAPGSMEFLADGQYEMLMADQSAFQFGTDMVMDMTFISNGVDLTDALMAEEGAPQFPMTIDMDMRGDITGGTFYFQSAALAQMMEQPDMANAWFKLDMNALFDQMGAELGMNYSDLLALSAQMQDMTFEEILTAALKATTLTDAGFTTTDTLEMINYLCADSSFVKDGSSYCNFMDLDGVKMSFILNTSGSKVNGYDIDLYALDDSGMEMSISTSMKGSEMVMEMGMGVSDMLAINMSMDGTYKTTTAKPATQPPAGSVIIDLNELMAQAIPQA